MTPMNLALGEAVTWLDGVRIVGDPSTVVSRVHTDTRSLLPGDLFVALVGERFDGSLFLDEARARGAVAVLCPASAAERLVASGLPGWLVADTREALGQLAAGWRRQWGQALLAVTGSNGKTTVTQMIAAILRAWRGEAALATRGNLNNDIGVPLTLLSLRHLHTVAVVEMGMNHPGEIARLAAMAAPTVALVNNAQREHLEFMGSVAAVAAENGAVLSALPADGIAVFPADDAYTPLWRTLAAGRRMLDFGEGGAVCARSCAWQDGVWQVRASTPAGELGLRLRVAGRHNVRNALAATACAIAAGVPPDVVARGLAGFEPVQGRSRALSLDVAGRPCTLVDDTYNANPDSVRAAIDVLADLPGPRLLVLGDMGEVGDQGPAFHAEVGHYAHQRGVDFLLTHGELGTHAAEAFPGAEHLQDMAALQARSLALLPGLRSVLVKGSRFMKMERVVEALTAAAPPSKEHVHAA